MFQVDPGYTYLHLVPNDQLFYLQQPALQAAGRYTTLAPISAPRQQQQLSSSFESDEFRMYEFKVKACPIKRAHDWTVCPFAHPGERARRRDPRRVGYVAVPFEEFRANQRCPRGERCEFAHGVFEYWLHPGRYRTRACTSAPNCTRKVCFFAHSPAELRPEARYWTAPIEELTATPTESVGGGGGRVEVEEVKSIKLQLERLTSAAVEGVSGARSSLGSKLIDSCEGEEEIPDFDVEWVRDLIG